jgi:5-(carboxyamino)imidazole ribonucleotide synthase
MILPGRTIGILGGGQLGRMFAIAARRLGYQIHCLDPIQYGPTGQIADVEINAAYDDLDAARRFATAVDVVTFEFENVPAEALAAIERIVPVRPSPFVLETTRHRLREKDFLSASGFPVAPYRAVKSLEELRVAITELGTPCVLKTAEFGYDGKGQSKILSPEGAEAAWKKLSAPLAVLEGFVHFDFEISVVGARGVDGAFHCYPPFVNEHRNHILDVTTTTREPAPAMAVIHKRAMELATAIAMKLDAVGTLCVEMFVRGSEVIVNEIAPRPHNSGHLTIDACRSCQFEQQVRAVCGLPMGNPAMLAPAAAMANLLGDVWDAGPPRWDRALATGAKLHLYGKSDPRPGRKMGHLTAIAETVDEARAIVLKARDALRA